MNGNRCKSVRQPDGSHACSRGAEPARLSIFGLLTQPLAATMALTYRAAEASACSAPQTRRKYKKHWDDRAHSHWGEGETAAAQ